IASGTAINQMIDVVTPSAGESVTEGTVLEWHVKVGDFIKVDDTIVEISTDKGDATQQGGQDGPPQDDGDGVAASATSTTSPQAAAQPVATADGARISPVAAR